MISSPALVVLLVSVSSLPVVANNTIPTTIYAGATAPDSIDELAVKTLISVISNMTQIQAKVVPTVPTGPYIAFGYGPCTALLGSGAALSDLSDEGIFVSTSSSDHVPAGYCEPAASYL